MSSVSVRDLLQTLPTFDGSVMSEPTKWLTSVGKMLALATRLAKPRSDETDDACKERIGLETTILVRAKLVGGAKSWVESEVPIDGDWQTFKEKFEAEFVKASRAGERHKAWEMARMEPDEDAHHFYHRLNELRNNLPKTSDGGMAVTEDSFYWKYCNGLRPGLHEATNRELTIMKNLPTFTELRALVANIERSMEWKESSYTSAVGALSTGGAGGTKGGSEQRSQGGRGGRRGASRKMLCWNCGQAGHRRTQCRRCWACGHEGHRSGDCSAMSWEKEAWQKKKKNNEQASKGPTSMVATKKTASERPGQERTERNTFIGRQGERWSTLNVVQVVIEGRVVKPIVDGGSEVSLVTRALAEELHVDFTPIPKTTIEGAGSTIADARATLDIEVGPLRTTVNVLRVDRLPYDMILGRDWLKEHGVKEDYRDGALQVGGMTISSPLQMEEPEPVVTAARTRGLRPDRIGVLTLRTGSAKGDLALVENRATARHVNIKEGIYRVGEKGMVTVLARMRPSEDEDERRSVTVNKRSCVANVSSMKNQEGREGGETRRATAPLPEDMTEEEDRKFEARLDEVMIDKEDLSKYVRERLGHLTEDQKCKVASAIWRNRRAFIKKDEIPVASRAPAYEIRVHGEARMEKVRPWSEPVERMLADQVQEMTEAGILSMDHQSPYRHEWVIVRKKDGRLRMTNDYSRTNINNIVADSYPIENMEQTVERLGGRQWYFKSDVGKSYWQVWLKKTSRAVTAVRVPGGVGVYNVAPMGLKVSASALGRALDATVMKELPPTTNSTIAKYVDDMVLAVSGSFEEALERAEELWRTMIRWRIQLALHKTEMAMKSVDAFGYHVSEEGVRPARDRIEAIEAVRAPQSKTELRSFLGATVQYRKFVPKFAEKAKPLTELTKKEKPFKWTNRCQQAFEQIKIALMEPPVLKKPDWSKPFVLATDASDVGIGAVLLQEEHPVAYHSETLTPTQSRWSTFDKEFYAGYRAMTRLSRFLAGTTFLWLTDHKPLLNYSASLHEDRTGKRGNWAQQMGTFDFEIEHVSGKKMNEMADPLSRPPFAGALRAERSEEQTVHSADEHADTEHWQREQRRDDWAGSAIKVLRYGGTDEYEGRRDLHQFTFNNHGLLVRLEERSDNEARQGTIQQIVVPASLRETILRREHEEGAHAGAERMKANLRERFWWPGIATDCRNWRASCWRCQEMAPIRDNKGLLDPHDVPGPWERVAYDLIGPLPESENGCRMALIGVDYGTDWPIAVPLRRTTTADIVRAMREVHATYGIPREIVSDGGPNLISRAAEQYYKDQQITKKTTSPYHARSNGKVENKIRTLKSLLHKLGLDADWEAKLTGALYALRTQVSPERTVSPFFLMYGRDPRAEDRDQAYRGGAYRYAYEKMQQLAEREKTKQKKTYDSGRKPATFETGELVWLTNHAKQRKGEPERRGPFRICGRSENGLTYTLGDSKYAKLGRLKKQAHVNFLDRFVGRNMETNETHVETTTPEAAIAWYGRYGILRDADEQGMTAEGLALHDTAPSIEESTSDDQGDAEEDEGLELNVDEVVRARTTTAGRQEYFVRWAPNILPHDDERIEGLRRKEGVIVDEESEEDGMVRIQLADSWEPADQFYDEDGTVTRALARFLGLSTDDDYGDEQEMPGRMDDDDDDDDRDEPQGPDDAAGGPEIGTTRSGGIFRRRD